MIRLRYESRFGLARGAVFAGNLPILFLGGLERDPAIGVLGTRSVARVTGVGAVSFLALADGAEAVLDAPQAVAAKLTEGAMVEITITAEARAGKAAVARWIAAAEGDPRRLSSVLTLKERLIERAQTLLGATPVEDDDGDLDAAADEALSPSGPLPGGGHLWIEPTRGLIACDVDTGAQGRDAAKRANEAAVTELGRRLKLSGLAGLIVTDLVGRKHDAERLRALLTEAFSPEDIIIGPIGKFGTMEFVRPWGTCPAAHVPAALRTAARLLRDAVGANDGRPGRLLTLRAPHDVLDIMRPLLKGSLDPLSPLIRLEPGPIPEIIAP